MEKEEFEINLKKNPLPKIKEDIHKTKLNLSLMIQERKLFDKQNLELHELAKKIRTNQANNALLDNGVITCIDSGTRSINLES